MDKLFLQIVNMSITSSYVILFVMAARLILKRFPKIFSYMLWMVVLVRLVCPFSLESIFSLIPGDEHIPQQIAFMPEPEINSGITAVDNAVNNILPPADQAASVNPMQVWVSIGETAWVMGVLILLAYSVYTSVKLYISLRKATHVTGNIYKMDGLKTPFVFGIIKPCIYLPTHITESEEDYILLHEQTHIRRLDHIIKPFFFLVTCIHWFNPLVWASFFLMSKDMELSCDEKVVNKMGSNIKKEYSSSLLSMSTNRRIVGGCPLAFGENNTKGRIKNILNYKKPALWVMIIVVIAVLAVSIGLITNPKSAEEINDLRPMIMVDGEIYLDTGKKLSVEIDESSIIGKTDPAVSSTEKPTQEGQTNFGLEGADYAYFDDGIAVLVNNEWVFFEKEIYDGVEVYLNKLNDFSGMYEEVVVKTKDNEKAFSWKNVYNPTYAPVTVSADADNDNKDEIIILLTTDYGTGVHVQDIHVLNAEDLTELNIQDPLEALNDTVTSSVNVIGDKVNATVRWYRISIEKNYDKSFSDNWFEEVSFGSHIEYKVEDSRIVAYISGAVSPSEFPFTAVLRYDDKLKITNIDVVDNEAIVETESYKKISGYMEEECKKVFSPYYELLDFKMSDYEEEIVGGNVEAVFHYKVIHKNYDKDPDTVQYIKEAKERGDKNYRQLYDEYLQPQEMNFYLKARIDENGKITLYYNFSPHGIDWQEIEMSDFIIK